MFHYQTVEELRQAAQEEGVTLPWAGTCPPWGKSWRYRGETPQPGGHPAHGGLRRHRRRQARGADTAPV